MRVLGYRLVPVAAHDAQRGELLHLRERSAKFENELSDLRKLAGEKGRALEMYAHHVEDARELAKVAEGRAEHAEAIARLQARTIERLMASNDRMVGLVSDMRRVGFGILEPLPETSDTPTTIEDEDRAAVLADPDLEADDL